MHWRAGFRTSRSFVLLALVVTGLVAGAAVAPAAATASSAGDAAALAPVLDAQHAGPWAQFHGNAAKTGWNATERRLSPHAARALREDWTAVDGSLVGSPIVVGNTVYAVSLAMDSDAASLVAVDAHKGTVRWTAPIDAYPTFPPGAIAYVNDTVVVMSGGALAGYAADTGTLAWAHGLGWSRGPTVSGTTVYVAYNDIADPEGRHHVRALDATTGLTLWLTELPGPIESIVTLAAGRVYASSGDDLYALAARDGRVLWHTPVGSVYGGGAAVLDGVAYVAANPGGEGGPTSTLFALDAKTGHVRWTADAGQDVHSVPAVDGTNVYVGSIDSGVRAISAHTGKLRWTWDSEGGEVWSSPTVANHVVYVTTDADHVVALAARTGDVLWTATPEGPGAYAAMGSPVVANGRLYVAFGQSGLRAYEVHR
jgi:outer membrane protein assembly factor BamB